MVKITLTSKGVAPRPSTKKTFMQATMYDVLLTVVCSTSMELPACENCFFELWLHYGAKLAKYARSIAKRFMIIHEGGGGGGGSKCDVIKRGGERIIVTVP